MLKGKRDATSLKVMEYVVGDEHTFDFWVQGVAPNGKIKAVTLGTGDRIMVSGGENVLPF